ncbi:MAG TPA: DUF3299 domain-containing protein [Tepidisphaeraceae bacterium]|nr:DUF3299 domain-containing protein [Tepidisphaeraceae bacterium]
MISRSLVILLLILTGVAFAQTTQPAASVDNVPLDIRANSLISRGEFQQALPLLEKLAKQAKGDSLKLGRIQEQIRMVERMIATGATSQPAVATSAEERTPHPAPKPGEVRETNIKELGNFDYDADKGGNVPDDVKALSGMKIRVKGFMIPMDQASNVTSFALVPDLFACCFGQPPQVQHMIIATCPPGKAVSYYPDELVVEGTFKVDEKKEDGFIISLFEMEVVSVKPTAK